MDAALLIARLLLALVFAVAGVAKLADLSGARRAVADFGVPSALASPLGLLLPLAELVIAALLIPASTAWLGALGALGLLLLFVAGIAINLARGRKPDCHCFGQLHSAPAGYSTLARNGLLAAVAGFVVWQGREYSGPSVFVWLGNLPAAQLVGLIVGLVVLGLLAGQWWVLSHLLSQNGRLLLRIEALEDALTAGGGVLPSQNGAHPTAAGLPVGSQAPDFSLKGLYGETLTLEALRASEKPIMLILTDPECGPCTALLPEIGRWQQEYDDKLTIALISRDTAKKNRAKITEHGVKHVLLQKDWEVSEAYEVSGTPSAVLVLADGTIGSPVVAGSEAIGSLLTQAVATIPASKIGEPAPSFRLSNLDGEDIDLADFRGEETLVLFWNPGCGFCQQMLPDLKEWESNPPKGAPKLLMVSAGSEEANKEMGLSSPMVLDQNFSVGREFGVGGTPSAVLVDAEGRVASGVAVGAPAVLELAKAGKPTA